MAGGIHLKGTISGIAHGIADSDNPTGTDLLADVNPTFNWVRLAQRRCASASTPASCPPIR